jgi:hypothetical protein
MKRKSKLSDEVRRAIDEAEISRYRLWKLTGIGEATLSRFMSGKGGLSTEGLDKIADILGLSIIVNKPKARKGGKHTLNEVVAKMDTTKVNKPKARKGGKHTLNEVVAKMDTTKVNKPKARKGGKHGNDRTRPGWV